MYIFWAVQIRYKLNLNNYQKFVILSFSDVKLHTFSETVIYNCNIKKNATNFFVKFKSNKDYLIILFKFTQDIL